MFHRRGFTVVELLVVICLICILAAILIPASNKIRQSAMRVSCLSNMRQITAASMTYAGDNGGQLPYCNWAGGGPTDGGVYQFGWMFTGPIYQSRYPNIVWNGPHYPSNGVMTGVIWPYLNNLAVYHCPLDQPEFYAGTNWLASYLENGAQCGYGASGGGQSGGMGAPLRRISQPGQSVMFWEALEQTYQGQSLTGAVWNDGASYPTEEVLADRHFKGANVSCFDGHAEWWDQATWQVNASAGGWSRLWCSPYSSNGH
ncbi:MAG TPA: type II secretion system protein [Tepidisphaeraceae bacterium]|jgi:prepilin-type N-terminal cleavage/methylation domain-containing protein|nr:type II secretion system protein [Tepidisphaeraceae bacterium]